MNPASHAVLLPVLKECTRLIEMSQTGFAASRAGALADADAALSRLSKLLDITGSPLPSASNLTNDDDYVAERKQQIARMAAV